jgi:hypothetical protein
MWQTKSSSLDVILPQPPPPPPLSLFSLSLSLSLSRQHPHPHPHKHTASSGVTYRQVATVIASVDAVMTIVVKRTRRINLEGGEFFEKKRGKSEISLKKKKVKKTERNVRTRRRRKGGRRRGYQWRKNIRKKRSEREPQKQTNKNKNTQTNKTKSNQQAGSYIFCWEKCLVSTRPRPSKRGMSKIKPLWLSYVSVKRTVIHTNLDMEVEKGKMGGGGG